MKENYMVVLMGFSLEENHARNIKEFEEIVNKLELNN